jgi:hypothetical protein
MVKQAGAWYSYTEPTTGEETKFQSKDFQQFLEADPARKEMFYNAICDTLIMKYQTEFDPEAINIEGASGDE